MGWVHPCREGRCRELEKNTFETAGGDDSGPPGLSPPVWQGFRRSQDKPSLPDEVYLCDNCYWCLAWPGRLLDGLADGAYLLQNLKS